jgi:hypothetical protein
MTHGGDHDRAGNALDTVRAASVAAGLALSDPDLAAVTAFLAALAPGLEALAAVGRELSDDPDEHDSSPVFAVEWR